MKVYRFRLAIFDGWGDIARKMVFGTDTNTKAAIFIVLLMSYLTIAALGIFNLLVGVMISIAVEQQHKDANMRETRRIATRFMVLKALREHPGVERDMKEWYLNPKNEEDRTPYMNRIAERHVVRWRKRWPFKHYFEAAGVSMRDVKTVVDEISGASSSVTIDIDDFIEGCTWICREPKATFAFYLTQGGRVSVVNPKFGRSVVGCLDD